jgi:hypothetical protein
VRDEALAFLTVCAPAVAERLGAGLDRETFHANLEAEACR